MGRQVSGALQLDQLDAEVATHSKRTGLVLILASWNGRVTADVGDTHRTTIVGSALPNIPWEERPAGSSEVVWRSVRNPVIPRDLLPRSNSIFNSAVVPFEDGFAGVFRVDHRTREMLIHSGKSRDGVDWEIAQDPIEFITDVPELKPVEHQYDPRVCWIEDRYYVTWCNGYHGPTIGVAYTYDFQDLLPDGECLPAPQPQRRPVPQKDQ